MSKYSPYIKHHFGSAPIPKWVNDMELEINQLRAEVEKWKTALSRLQKDYELNNYVSWFFCVLYTALVYTVVVKFFTI
jgi:hypothetical protein